MQILTRHTVFVVLHGEMRPAVPAKSGTVAQLRSSGHLSREVKNCTIVERNNARTDLILAQINPTNELT